MRWRRSEQLSCTRLTEGADMGTLLVLFMMFGAVMIGSSVLVIAARISESTRPSKVPEPVLPASRALAEVDLRTIDLRAVDQVVG